jgi:hypothetical protein
MGRGGENATEAQGKQEDVSLFFFRTSAPQWLILQVFSVPSTLNSFGGFVG